MFVISYYLVSKTTVRIMISYGNVRALSPYLKLGSKVWLKWANKKTALLAAFYMK